MSRALSRSIVGTTSSVGLSSACSTTPRPPSCASNETVPTSTPIVTLLREPVNATVPIWEEMVDARTAELTANDNTLYTWFWIDLHHGPLVVEVPHKVRGSYFTVGSPIKFSDLKPEVTASPLLGQHTDEVLEELGYTSQQIKAMHEAKAV